MKNYERPIVMINEDLAEGVYAASGVAVSTCYVVDSFGCQPPFYINEVGKYCWTVHVDGFHKADHHSSFRLITITFNQAVEVYNPGNGTLVSGNNTATIVVSLPHHNTGDSDNIGLSSLTVLTDSKDGLKIQSAVISDCNQTCGC